MPARRFQSFAAAENTGKAQALPHEAALLRVIGSVSEKQLLDTHLRRKRALGASLWHRRLPQHTLEFWPPRICEGWPSSLRSRAAVEQMDDGFMGFLVIVGGVALSLYVWKELARGECLK